MLFQRSHPPCMSPIATQRSEKGNTTRNVVRRDCHGHTLEEISFAKPVSTQPAPAVGCLSPAQRGKTLMLLLAWSFLGLWRPGFMCLIQSMRVSIFKKRSGFPSLRHPSTEPAIFSCFPEVTGDKNSADAVGCVYTSMKVHLPFSSYLICFT